jgi:hypothetical protein
MEQPDKDMNPILQGLLGDLRGGAESDDSVPETPPRTDPTEPLPKGDPDERVCDIQENTANGEADDHTIDLCDLALEPGGITIDVDDDMDDPDDELFLVKQVEAMLDDAESPRQAEIPAQALADATACGDQQRWLEILSDEQQPDKFLEQDATREADTDD